MQYLAPILIFIAFSFVASILALIPKGLFFLKRRNAYEYILRHSIIAIGFGIALAYGIYFYFRQNMEDQETEQLLGIPFYGMLAGMVTGTLRLYISDKLSKK